MVIAYLFLCVRMMHVLRHLGRQLATLDYVPPAYYDFRIPPLKTAMATIAVTVAPAAVAVALMLIV